MTNQIPNTFRTSFQDEWKMDFDREMTPLRLATNPSGVIAGKIAYFDVVDPSDEAVEKTRDGKIPKSDLGLDQVPATLRKHHKKYQVDNFDAFRANPKLREAMNRRGKTSCDKAIDNLILRALDATSVVHPDGTVVAKTMAVIQSACLVLQNKDVPFENREVFGAVTPAFYAQMERIEQFINADYVEVKPLIEGLPAQKFRHWKGVNWFTHTGLTGNGTTTSNNFLFHRNALGHMVDGDPKAIPFENDEDDYNGVRYEIMHAACTPLPRGIIKIVHNDQASLTA